MIGGLEALCVFVLLVIWPRLAAVIARLAHPDARAREDHIVRTWTALLLTGWAVIAGIMIAIPWLI